MIDDHAHPFFTEFAAFDLDGVSLQAGGVGQARRRSESPGRLFAELLSVRLARFVGAEVAELSPARDEAARSDWAGWVRRLFDDADISAMLLDEGVPAGSNDTLVHCAEVAGRPMLPLARVDPVVDRLIESGASARELVSALEDFMAGAAAHGAVGFKTILAYRTGLGVDPDVSMKAAEASLGEEAVDTPLRRRAKPLRDLLTRRLLETAADLGKPVQFHTGFGDSELRLAESDPLLLEELLRSSAGSATPVVLIHGSYPWHEAVAYLAAVRPNVYAEVSLANLFAPLTTAERLAKILELAPADKVLAGSDGHGAPETHWFACKVLQDAFYELADRLGAAGARAGFVEATRSAFFEDNAARLYGLG